MSCTDIEISKTRDTGAMTGINFLIIYLELKLFSINCVRKTLFKVNLGHNKIREKNC